MAGRVIVVGSTNTDLVVHCDRLPGPGETVLGGDLLTFAGGKGANQAVAAARAGAKVFFIGAFGDDAFGTARRRDLEKEGVDCSGCVVKKGVPSGVALIAIGEGRARAKAENLIFVAPGANLRLTPADVKRAMPKKLRAEDACICSLEVPLPTARAALKLAWRDCGTVILNPAPFPARGLPQEFMDCCHFLTPNESEFEQLVGVPVGSRAAQARVRALRGAHGLCYPRLLVTRGARGVDCYDVYRPAELRKMAGEVKKLGRRFGLRLPPPSGYEPGFATPPRVRAVDTVGAGDCFNGGLAAQFSFDSHNVNAAVAFAVAAAAIKVTRHGAQAGMPKRAEILKMMKLVGGTSQ
jgi:ribokinase